MNFGILRRVFLCILILGDFLYAYISKQNTITKIRLEIPLVAKELEEICQENSRLRFEIDQFENPIHLMDLSRNPEYRHLKHPLLKDIIEIRISQK